MYENEHSIRKCNNCESSVKYFVMQTDTRLVSDCHFGVSTIFSGEKDKHHLLIVYAEIKAGGSYYVVLSK